MPERRRGSFPGLITIIIGGIIVCSVLGASGLWMPFAPAAAAVLGGVGMILIIKWHRSRHLLPDARGYRERDDLLKPAFEIAVRISYIGRISRRRGMALLESTAGFLTVCERLRARLEKCEQLSEGKESTASEAGGPAREEVADWKSEETTGALGAMLEEVTSTVREMAGVLRDVDHNAKELITSTEETAYSMTRLDSFLQDMANSGRDLEASTDTANRVALEGTKVVEEMGKENEAIISTVNEAASAVEDLGRWSQEVGKIVEVIRDIANETNLLALNASIIAAQSGEHGKAFGVVAEEIRGLAERTSSSTKEISDLVKAVQKNVANVVNGMKKSLQRVERGELLTRNAGTVLEKVFESFESSRNLAKQIASSTFEHKIDSSQVVRSLHKVTDIARRLQTHNFAGWTGAGETLGVVRALSALSMQGNGLGKEHISGEPKGKSRTGSHAALSGEPAESGIRGLLTALDHEIECCVSSIEDTRNTLGSWLEVLDGTAATVKQIFGAGAIGDGSVNLGPCWETVRCDADLREKCPAYKAGDGSLFFSAKAACAQQTVEGEIKPTVGHSPSPSDSGRADQIAHKVGP